MCDHEIDFTDLDTLDAEPVKGRKAEERFPCPTCQGTGKYRGVRVHQHRTDCFACNGRGYFKTSPEARAKARTSRAASKRRKHQDALAKFEAQYPGLRAFLDSASDWSDFARSLHNSLVQYGSLTERQVSPALRMKEKVEARKAAAAAKPAAAELGDISGIVEVFKVAGLNLKHPKLRVDGDLVISLAPTNGRNAGSLYVKRHGEYQGKVSPEGRWYPLRSTPADVADHLKAFAAHPADAAKAYGQKYGICCCCGRELTNHISIEAGIGPICAENFGF